MWGKQQATGQRSRDTQLQPQAEQTEERGDKRVREEVDEMKAGWPQAMEDVVHAEWESGEGTEGFVWLWIREALTPEVILKDLREGSIAPVSVMRAYRFDDHYQSERGWRPFTNTNARCSSINIHGMLSPWWDYQFCLDSGTMYQILILCDGLCAGVLLIQGKGPGDEARWISWYEHSWRGSLSLRLSYLTSGLFSMASWSSKTNSPHRLFK